VKNTYSDKIPHEYDWTDQFDVKEVIETGVKHTEYGDWEDGDERLDDIIDNGIKETKEYLPPRTWMPQQVIENGVKETHDDAYHHTGRIGGVIKNGVKETWGYERQPQNRINEVIKSGTKENPS
jgi:hypothetical protein